MMKTTVNTPTDPALLVATLKDASTRYIASPAKAQALDIFPDPPRNDYEQESIDQAPSAETEYGFVIRDARGLLLGRSRQR